jgi:peptide/nickel transport system permease protein
MALRGYLAKRIAFGLLILFVIATLNFLLFQVFSPVDPASVNLDPRLSVEVRERMREIYGLLDPLYIRYLKYLRNMFTWNFGWSFRSMRPVAEDMSWRLMNTVLLLGSVLICTIALGIPIGILAASRRGTKTDLIAIGSGIFTFGVPTFFIQLLCLLFFSYYFRVMFGFQLFPPAGLSDVPPPTEPIAYMANVAWHMAMPLFTLVISGFGAWSLYTRNILLDSLTQDYIVTARAKGLSERTVLFRHAFRSSLPPIVTIIALAIPGIVTGALITEQIFSWPGIGSWYISGLQEGDYPVVQAVMFIYAVLMIIANIVADLLYAVLDPRIRVGMGR